MSILLAAVMVAGWLYGVFVPWYVWVILVLWIWCDLDA